MSIEIYEQVGLELAKVGNQLVGDCPSCGKTKFYVDPVTTKYSCKVCHESGNDTTILGLMAEKVWRPGFTDARADALSKYRKNLPVDAFWITENLGYSEVLGQYTWIVRKQSGGPHSYRTFELPKPGKRNAVRAAKGRPLGLLGAEALGDSDKATWPVYVTEGEWDYHAMLWLVMVTGQKAIVTSVPGAGTFPEECVPWVRGRDVIGLYDNDDPGRKGTLILSKRVKDSAKSLRFLHWTEDKKDGYDLDDLVREYLRKPKDAWAYIQGCLQGKPTMEPPQVAARQAASNAKQAEQEQVTPCSVVDLHIAYKKWLLLENTDLLDVVMGCLWTCHLPGNPLWMFIVSPPSSSKSETLVPVGDWWRCLNLSTVTARGIISGMQGPGGADPSLLAQLDGTRGALIIKDLTPLLQTRHEERDEVFGILRDAYDGSCSRMFGNGVTREYKDLNFCILAGVTPAIDAMSNVAMGERFLKFRPDREFDRHDEEARAVRAIQNSGSLEQMRVELKDASVRCLQREYRPENIRIPEGETIEFVARLAQIVAWMRGAVMMDDKSGKMLSRPIVESSPRLALQFVKLAQGLALHLEAASLTDKRVTGLLRRVALHTGDALVVSVIQQCWKLQASVTKKELWRMLPKMNFATISAALDITTSTGLTVKCDETGYRLSQEAARLLESTRLFDGLPRTDPFWQA